MSGPAEDRSMIEALLYEYARRIDDGDFAGVGELFAQGSICGPDGSVLAEGADAVTALYAATTRRYEDGTPRSHHVTTNVAITVGLSTAEAKSYFTVFQATDSLPLQPVVAGRYEDRFARAPGGWRFAERIMHVRLVGDVSQHLLVDLPPAW
jgi:3-phenylpropionate/cinnamic acid dioxygenase small subunit